MINITLPFLVLVRLAALFFTTEAAIDCSNEPCPIFLMAAKDRGKRDFEKIFQNGSLTKAQVDARVEQWASRQGYIVEEAYRQSRMMADRQKWLLKDAVRDSSLNNTIKQTFYRIESIENLGYLTPYEESLIIGSLFKRMRQTEKTELCNFVLRNFALPKYDLLLTRLRLGAAKNAGP